MAMPTAEILATGQPADGSRLLPAARGQLARRLRVDRLARRLVTSGGLAIIASILAIFVVIALEVAPLLKKPTARLLRLVTAAMDSVPLAVGVDDYREVAYVVTGSGVHVVSTEDGARLATTRPPALETARVVGVSPLGRGAFALGLSDGRLIPVEVTFTVSYPEGRRRIAPEVTLQAPITADPAVTRIAHGSSPGGPVTAAAVGPKEIVLVAVKEPRALIGPSTPEVSRRSLSLPVEGAITALALDQRGESLFVGSSDGQLLWIDLREPDNGTALGTAATQRAGVAVTTLGFVLGDRTLVVGDAAGAVSSWQLLTAEGGERRLVKVHEFVSHAAPVAAFAPSRRDKGFLTADASGTIHLHYGTTGKTLLTVAADGAAGSVGGLAYAPKGDGFILADTSGRLWHWTLDNRHPEVTWRSLFGKVWYEGYSAPEYVWQSTGGTDDFEAKFSLTPLIYGTLKGTFYALLLAVPLALLGALYTSQFMHPALKGIVKPIVEIMAALPSVVLGFLAGLWLAPAVERVVPGLLLVPLVVPALIVTAAFSWHVAPAAARKRVRAGTEIWLLIPVVVLGIWVAFQLGAVVEGALLAGDYRAWLLHTLGLAYDQRNSLVVGLAMGFAVIPIIFTIAEDALANVPQHLVAASLALGATRWQTATRIIVPTASPGIFSAIMIGFGRAIGETMIVLMATGNTPVMDWSIFTGFRALSATIAVELPEAPEGGTLFRVLFLAALLLFVVTFVVNTVAEVVRLKLRRRYRYL